MPIYSAYNPISEPLIKITITGYRKKPFTVNPFEGSNLST